MASVVQPQALRQWLSPEPDEFPPAWASAWGEDGDGRYAELPVGRTTQRFRWIVPGTFQMGSPATEKERREDETQHEVTLTKGYWLADTTVTQALWLEVMGSNPSRFTGEARLPVDSVSWDDAQTFIARLNERVPGLMAGLPSEAQWEYACRAGTETPFSFGETITPEQVNYDGNYPYGKARKGLYRQRPVPVGSLPANRWGLYEMHGNVWEWCSDWYGAYGRGPQRDPEGPPMGSYRVLRGGSWFFDAGDARSARRDANVPGYRLGDIGFRLAPGRMGAGPAERGRRGEGDRAGRAKSRAPAAEKSRLQPQGAAEESRLQPRGSTTYRCPIEACCSNLLHMTTWLSLSFLRQTGHGGKPSWKCGTAMGSGLVLARSPKAARKRFCWIAALRHFCHTAHMKTTLTVTARGVVTLPAKLRRALGIKADDQLIAETTPDGLLLRPAVTLPVEMYSEKRVREFDQAEAELEKVISRRMKSKPAR